jgi:hypothetical protein
MEHHFDILCPLLCMQLLLIRYTQDVMHCETNLAKNFLKTICRNKDAMKVGRDLQGRGLRWHLWLTNNPLRPMKMFKLATLYVLFDEDFRKFANCIKLMKTSKGYAPTLGKHIRRRSLWGLNRLITTYYCSRFCHLLRILLQPGPRLAVLRMYKVFRRICTKVYNPADFNSLKANVAESMALLEMELFLCSLTS